MTDVTDETQLDRAKKDPLEDELQALTMVVAQLADLEPDQRERVLAYAVRLFGIDVNEL